MHVPPARIAITVWFLVALPFHAGCHVGSAPESGSDDDGPTPDAAGGGDGEEVDGGGGGGAPTECENQLADVADTGHHPEGYDFQQGNKGCITANCHDGSSAGPTYTVAGSVYTKQVAEGDPVAGVFIYVTDANDKVVKMTTAQNGFFYTTEPVVPPFATFVSGCPQLLPMIGFADGNCNRAGCHATNYKIYHGPTP